MAHTWIRKPDVVMPPVLKGVYSAGFAIKHMEPRYWFVRLDVEVTIKGSLRCAGGQIRDVETAVRANIMVPIDALMIAMGSVLAGVWIKTTWWLTRGASIVSPILRKAEEVENIIKKYVDGTDKICLGAVDLISRNHIELKEPIYLDENYRPLYILPPGRAQMNFRLQTKLA